MRLTLRTMLAYLDDVLEPNDAHELERKIEESTFASGLVQRIRASIRRPRLGAPQLTGKEMGLDPNSVAEYLDSTLEPSSVPEFEKVCLESDVHLAEVASCHQILTLVLTEPAEVEPALRQRIYRLGHAAPTPSSAASNGSTQEDTHAAVQSATPAAQAATATSAPGAFASIPIKSLALTLLLGFLFAFILFQLTGTEKLRGLLGLRSGSGPVAQTSGSQVVATQPVTEPLEETAGPLPSAEATEPPAEGSTPEPVAEPTTTAADAVLSPNSGGAPAAVESVASEVEAPGMGGDVAAVSEPTATEPSGDDPAVAAQGETPAVVPEPASAQREVAKVASAEPVAEPSGEGEVRNLTPVGRYVSEEQVLARFDEAREGWFLLPPDTPLAPGDQLLTLPTYRPQLMLVPGIKVTLSGESRVQVERTQAEPLGPSLVIEFGQAVIVPVGDPSLAVHLDLGGRRGTLLFADAHSIVAVNVKRYLAPGVDARTETAAVAVELYAVSGEATWHEGETAARLGAGQVLVLINDEPPGLFEAGTLPAWIEGNNLSDIDRLASAELRRYLPTDRPLMLSLLERINFRKIDIRALACRALCSLDVFEPAFEALGNQLHHSYWDAHFDSLRNSAARDQATAMKVFTAAKKVGGDKGEELFRSLMGYSPDQLKAGGAETLVGQLESERLDLRVLAFENLRRITGKTHLFRPEQPTAQEKRKVMNWRRTLDTGGVVYETPPSPVAERVAVPPEPPGGEEAATR